MGKGEKERHDPLIADAALRDALGELVRGKVRDLLAAALEEEFNVIQERLAGRRLADGRPAVIRNGYHRERDLLTGCGPVPVSVPRLRARGEEPFTFRSELVPPHLRRCRVLDETLPWVCLRGVSQGNMQEALSTLLGMDVATRFPQLLGRLKRRWEREHEEWLTRPLGDLRIARAWAGAVHFRAHGEASASACMLVVIGIDDQDKKSLLAIEPDTGESAHSWQRLLHLLAERGLAPPRWTVSDDATGFWAALERVFPQAG